MYEDECDKERLLAEASKYYKLWRSELERANRLAADRDRLRAEVEALKKGIQDAIDYANGRQYEWGSRAEACFDILERALRGKGKQ